MPCRRLTVVAAEAIEGRGKTTEGLHTLSDEKPKQTAYVDRGFAWCPVHHSKLCAVDKTATSKGVRLYCKMGKHEVMLELPKEKAV